MLYQDKYLVVSVKLNFCQRQTDCIDDQDTFQSVTDTDNEFTGNSIGISPASLRASMKTLKKNNSEPYKLQGDCLKVLEPNSYNKNDMKEKVNDLVRSQEEMQEN